MSETKGLASNPNSRAGKMAGWIRSLALQAEGLSLNPQHPCKKPEVTVLITQALAGGELRER